MGILGASGVIYLQLQIAYGAGAIFATANIAALASPTVAAKKRHRSNPRPQPDSLVVWRRFLQAHRLITDELDRELRQQHDLPLDWYDVLVQLHEAGGSLTMGRLARSVLISPSNCSRLIDRMSKRGVVERRADPDDGRTIQAVITAEGRRLLRRASTTHLAGIERHFTGLLDEPEVIGSFFAQVTERLTTHEPEKGNRGGGA